MGLIARMVRRPLARKLRRPRLRQDAAPRRPLRRVVVFGRLPNPTHDYYLAARLGLPDMPPFQVEDLRRFDPASIDPEGAFVIICRYASRRLLAWLKQHNDRLAGVGLFVDDDIPAVITGEEAEFGYRLFLWYRAVLPLRKLNAYLDVIWASTAPLARAIGEEEVTVLEPAPPAGLWQGSPRPRPVGDPDVVIAYHATGIHVAEHRFLRAVMDAVLAQRPKARFEVVAGKKAAPVWAGLARVTVLRPMPWAQYLALAGRRRVDIMLVPLSPSPVNDCRSGTKRIDVARFGAAGVFSQSMAYGKGGHDGEADPDGSSEFVLPYRVETWVATILTLIDDPALRARTAAATKARVSALGRAAVEAAGGPAGTLGITGADSGAGAADLRFRRVFGLSGDPDAPTEGSETPRDA